MSSLPDFTSHGYQVVRELGRNLAGGRVAYLAISTNSQLAVVIKQFQFALEGASWSVFKAYEREIEVLQGLNHPGIPRYLDSFETPTGFCMVQEYKDAQPLSVRRSFDADEIKKIAVSILEILVYLQNRIPPVIHRDIKPENILVDAQLNVYLVDFGFARIGSEEVAMSSIATGTLGFMPPEQLFNRHLTAASDLYGLGATLICLITGTKSTAIGNLIDEANHIHFNHLVPKLSLRWIAWLQKMVEPKLANRYPNAAVALQALKPVHVIRLPEVKPSHSSLKFTATNLDQKLTQTIRVSNSVPETLLEGTWEVAPHPNDRPHIPAFHAWISFQPARFTSNQAECKITVDTSQLMADKTYSRKILLHTNSLPETRSLTIKVQTAAIETKPLPYGSLMLLFLLAGWAAWVTAGVGGLAAMFAGVVAGVVVLAGIVAGSVAAAAAGSATAAVAAVAAATGFRFMVGILAGIGAGVLAAIVVESFVKRGFSTSKAVGISLLTAALGISLGYGVHWGLHNLFVISTVLVTGVPLAKIMIAPFWQRSRLIAKYRQSEQHLIKP